MSDIANVPSCTDFGNYADCHRSKEGSSNVPCCVWCYSPASCITWSHWDNTTFPSCRNFSLWPEHVQECIAFQKNLRLEMIWFGLIVLGIIAVIAFLFLMYWFFFGFGLCLRRTRHILNEQARQRRRATWNVTIATLQSCLPCRIGPDPTRETMAFIGAFEELDTTAQRSPRGTQGPTDIVVEEIHHNTPPASRDASLLQLQADHEWADHVATRIQTADLEGTRELAQQHGHMEAESSSMKIFLLRFRSAPKSCGGKGTGDGKAQRPGTEQLREKIMQGPQFSMCRDALKQARLDFVHPTSGAIMALHPAQHRNVQQWLTAEKCVLHPYHIIISGDLEYLLEEILSAMPFKMRPKVKDGECGRQEVNPATEFDSFDGLSEESDMHLRESPHVHEYCLIERHSFLSFEPVLHDERSVVQSDQGRRHGINPRRYT